MRRLLLGSLLTAVAIGGFAVPTMAQDNVNRLKTGWYGTLGAGWVVPQDYDASGGVEELKTENGYSLLAGGGYSFGNGFRAEGEISYGSFDNDLVRFSSPRRTVNTDGSVDQYALTGAVYYDIPTGISLTPYLGAGGGIMHQRNDRPAVSANGVTLPGGDDTTDLTAFGEVGLSYQLASNFDLVPAYRYQWINDGENGLDDTTQHVFKVGLRYWFN